MLWRSGIRVYVCRVSNLYSLYSLLQKSIECDLRSRVWIWWMFDEMAAQMACRYPATRTHACPMPIFYCERQSEAKYGLTSKSVNHSSLFYRTFTAQNCRCRRVLTLDCHLRSRVCRFVTLGDAQPATAQFIVSHSSFNAYVGINVNFYRKYLC